MGNSAPQGDANAPASDAHEPTRRKRMHFAPDTTDAARTCRRCFHTIALETRDDRAFTSTTANNQKREGRTLSFRRHGAFYRTAPRVEATPIERHIFAQNRRRIEPRRRRSPLSTQLLRASGRCDCKSWERRHRLRRCPRERKEASNAVTAVANPRKRSAISVLTRGIPTQRVTILLNRRVATQRASPLGRRRVL